ncbi:uncharacterized protein H6S33_004117 [Morchella sextelata]|uniref:uncharacterized protein n=1 Tax=Morchella sextelata TaxID=1174677 RepID=UPI001D044526|nr:uncharacterized protein H6S33_004117 [Morchella sextelata]KAH0606456.1 hypothetical protein H6S33_004117 [Morchella sextelata]
MFGKDVQRHKQVFNMEELTESSDEGELGFEEAPAGERGDQLDEFLEENYEEVEDEYEDIEVPLNPPGTLDPAQIGLPPAPIFNHFEHLAPAHQRQIHLPIAFRTAGIAREGGDGVLLREEDADVSPNGVLFTGRSSQLDRNQIVEHGPGVQGVCWDTPGRFFKLFFTEETFKQLADNTNAYANSKRAGHHNGSGRQWKTVETAELKIFIAMGAKDGTA